MITRFIKFNCRDDVNWKQRRVLNQHARQHSSLTRKWNSLLIKEQSRYGRKLGLDDNISVWYIVDILQVLNKKIVIYWMINKPNSWHRSSRYNKISMSNIAFCSTLNKTTKEYKTKGKDIHCHHRNLSSQQILKQKFPY